MGCYQGFEKDAAFVRNALRTHLNQGMTPTDISINADLLAEKSAVLLQLIKPADISAAVRELTGLEPSGYYVQMIRKEIVLARMRRDNLTWQGLADRLIKN